MHFFSVLSIALAFSAMSDSASAEPDWEQPHSSSVRARFQDTLQVHPTTCPGMKLSNSAVSRDEEDMATGRDSPSRRGSSFPVGSS